MKNGGIGGLSHADSEFFNKLNTGESFTYWEYFLPSWQNNARERYHLLKDDDLAGFMLSEECRAGGCPEKISAEVQSTEILFPFSIHNIRIRITSESLEDLIKAGVPPEVIELVKPLVDREFEDEALFDDLLRELLGDVNFEEYQDDIWQHSSTELVFHSSWIPPPETPLQKEAAQVDMGQSAPKTPKKKPEGTEQAPVEDWLTQLRNFCDKWGLPRPKTFLWLLLLLYLSVTLIRSFVRSRQ